MLQLKTALDTNTSYHRAFVVDNFVTVEEPNLDQHRMIPFSAVADLERIAVKLMSALDVLTAKENEAESLLADLQSQMARSKTKHLGLAACR